MDKFDDQYMLLEQLYEDSFYPDFLVDKLKYLLEDFINYLETNPKNQAEVEDKMSIIFNMSFSIMIANLII